MGKSNREYRMISYKKVKVYYEHNNNGKVFGIDIYDGKNVIRTTWYETEEERDYAYQLHRRRKQT